MNEYRPTRWPCSADSSRNAGDCGSVPRSLRNAATGVSQSSMKLWRTGTRLCSRASARTSSRLGETGSAAGSAATAIEHLLRLLERAVAAVEEHNQVVEDVGRLLVDAVVGLLAGGARDLLGLLLDLRADARRVVEELDGVRACGAGLLAVSQRSLELRERLMRRGRLDLAVVEARARAGVAGGAGGLDEGEERVAVAVEAQGPDRLGVARRGALVPLLVARAAVEVQLAGVPGALEGLFVHVGEGQDLAGAPVLDDARDESALVEGDVGRVEHGLESRFEGLLARILAAAAVVALGWLAGAVGLPSSYLFAALVVGVGVALVRPAAVSVPPWGFTAGQAVTGVGLGAYLRSSTLSAVADDWLPVAL